MSIFDLFSKFLMAYVTGSSQTPNTAGAEKTGIILPRQTYIPFPLRFNNAAREIVPDLTKGFSTVPNSEILS